MSSLESKMKRDSQNYRIQGPSASMVKLSGIFFYKKLKQLNLTKQIKLVLNVHDEIVSECEIQYADFTENLLVDCMMKSGKIFCEQVPMKVDHKRSIKWEH